ncbi:MAG: glycosyltransferase family 4 protein [Solirubrobacteraceae bacterium]
MSETRTPREASPVGVPPLSAPAARAPARPLHVVSVQTSAEQGGAEYANVELLSGLQAHADVSFLGDQPGLVEGTEVPFVHVELGPKLKRSTLLGLALGLPRLLLRLGTALRAEARSRPIDVLLLHFKKEQLLAALLPRSLTGAVVWAEWGPLPGPLTAGPARLLYLAAARRAALVVAVSQTTRESLLRAGVPAEKIAVIDNIVDSDMIAFDEHARRRHRSGWELSEEAFVIGCVTRLSASKRNDVIIDALAYLPENVLLVLAGSGEHEAALRLRAARYGDRVRFLPTPRGYVHEILSACDLLVFAPQAIEGAPRSIIFGQLCERPVLASGPEGARDMVLAGTGTIVSPAHDPRALASSIEAYSLDPERRIREGRAGRELAQSRYSREGVIADWLERLRGAADSGADGAGPLR